MMKTQTPILIQCACGCGGWLEDRDARGRPKKFLPSHWSKTQVNYDETVTCANCGAPLRRERYRVQAGGRHFCNRSCRAATVRETGELRGTNNGHYNSVTVGCAACDTPITKPVSLVFRRNNRVYCDGCKLRKNPDGPVSWTDYPAEFSRKLRAKIRERDQYTCQVCGRKRAEIGTPDVHHIDYDKHNNDERNLISLCESCHGQTNFGQESWKARLQDLMNRRYPDDSPEASDTGNVESADAG